MKRFADLNEWNDGVAENIRSDYKKRYGVDLKKYIPQEECTFFEKWKELIDASFGTEWSYMEFDDVSIYEFVNSFLMSHENDDKLLNAVNRYEFYEADLWISVAYTIRYLEVGDNFKQLNIRDFLTMKNKEQKDILYRSKGEQCFCWKFIDYLSTHKGVYAFNEILNDNQDFCLKPPETEDVTRWTWQEILQNERDIFYSQLITQKEYNSKKMSLDEDLTGKNAEYFKQLRLLNSRTKIEDLVLYWKLTGGELVRRFLPIFHINDGKKMMRDMRWLDKLCHIDSISWQIILIEIYKEISFDNSEINYPYWFNHKSIGSIIGSEDIQSLSHDTLKDIHENSINKYKELLEWQARIIECEVDKINENRKLLVEAMVYLYMESNKKVQGEALGIIQNNAKAVFNDIQTPPISCFQQSVNSYLKGDLDINDTLTKEMIQDLEKRKKTRPIFGVKKLKNSFAKELGSNYSLTEEMIQNMKKRMKGRKETSSISNFNELVDSFFEGEIGLEDIFTEEMIQDLEKRKKTRPISLSKELIKSFLDGEIDIEDIFTEDMFQDLKRAISNRKNSQTISEFKKIRLQNNEDSLTARYVLLQRLVMRILAQRYELIEN